MHMHIHIYICNTYAYMVQAQFAGVLRDLCISDEIALEIHQAGGVESIIDAARRHFDSVAVQAAVAGALRNLSELDEVRRG
jgi:hypothetical protein